MKIDPPPPVISFDFVVINVPLVISDSFQSRGSQIQLPKFLLPNNTNFYVNGLRTLHITTVVSIIMFDQKRICFVDLVGWHMRMRMRMRTRRDEWVYSRTAKLVRMGRFFSLFQCDDEVGS